MEYRDCSNCKLSDEIAPYKVLMRCSRNDEVVSLPHYCDKWTSILDPTGKYSEPSYHHSKNILRG